MTTGSICSDTADKGKGEKNHGNVSVQQSRNIFRPHKQL